MIFAASLRRRPYGFSAFPLAIAALLSLLMPARPARAQTFDATTLREPTDLGMTWLVKAGDDPAYARTNYDDSHWMVVDPSKSLKTYFRNSHPSVVWYRLHVKVAPNQTGLGLEEWNLTSAFEIYVDGQRLLHSGSIDPVVPYTLGARLLARIPDAAIQTGSFVIAMRVFNSQGDWVNAFPGLYPYNVELGQEAALRGSVWLTTIGQNALEWFYCLAMAGLGMIALALFTAQKQQREYFWIALMALTVILHLPMQLYQLFHNLPAWSAYITGGFEAVNIVLMTLMYLAFLRMRVARWIQAVLAISAIGILYNSMETARAIGSSTSIIVSLTPEFILFAAIIPVLLIVHWRRGNREAGILLIPVIVNSVSVYVGFGGFILTQFPAFSEAAVRLQNAIFNQTVGPFTINFGNLGGCLFALSLAIILVRRSTRIAAQQAHIETEMAAAREVQQILVPEQNDSVPGFVVESAYEPAQEVGGDFFQIMPAPEGSMLVVIGDVAGKGLPAAMLVSVLVGAIRGVTEYTSCPAELLANLNQRLVGRVAGNLTTAVAARIYPDGAVELANAGHLSPYLDGREVDVPGALPLGAKAGTRYETVRFLLPRGSRLTFYSDGIVEAQNAQGELFGFERSGNLAMLPVNKIVETAQMFGQRDDMTAISITRAAPVEAAARAAKAATPALGLVTS